MSLLNYPVIHKKNLRKTLRNRQSFNIFFCGNKRALWKANSELLKSYFIEQNGDKNQKFCVMQYFNGPLYCSINYNLMPHEIQVIKFRYPKVSNFHPQPQIDFSFKFIWQKNVRSKFFFQHLFGSSRFFSKFLSSDKRKYQWLF